MKSSETIKIPNPEESQYVAESQAQPLEDLQIRAWNNRNISGIQTYAFAIQSTSWNAGDWTLRNVNLIGYNGDREKSYTTEIIQWMWNTTALVTKQTTFDTPTNSVFRVPSWKVLEVSTLIGTATISVKVNITGTTRFLRGSSLTLTSTVPEVTVMNSGQSDLVVTLQFSTSAWERPSFWILMKII